MDKLCECPKCGRQHRALGEPPWRDDVAATPRRRCASRVQRVCSAIFVLGGAAGLATAVYIVLALAVYIVIRAAAEGG